MIATVRRAAARPGIRRARWTFTDQALVSAGNLVLSFTVARAVGPDEFGAFAIAFALVTMAQGFARAFGTEPLTVRFSTGAATARRDATTRALGTAVAIGAVGSVVVAAAAVVADGPLRANLLALVPCLPALLLQDAWRFAFFADGAPRRAAAHDALWLAVLGACFAGLTLAGTRSSSTFVVGWGIAAGVASVAGMARTGIRPTFATLPGWVRSNRSMSPSLLGDYVVTGGVTQLVLFGLGGLAGLEAVGALRGAQVLFGPVQVVTLGATTLAIPEGARLLERSTRSLLVGMAVVSTTGVLLASAWGLATWSLLRGSLGPRLLGETWSLTEPVIPSATALVAAIAASSGAICGLRVLHRADASFGVRLLLAPVMVVGSLGGASVAGAPGAVWGLAVPTIVGAVAWWHRLLAAARGWGTATSAAPAPEPSPAP